MVANYLILEISMTIINVYVIIHINNIYCFLLLNFKGTYLYIKVWQYLLNQLFKSYYNGRYVNRDIKMQSSFPAQEVKELKIYIGL